MTISDLEVILNEASKALTKDIKRSNRFRSPEGFMQRAKEVLAEIAQQHGFTSGATFHPSAFPDLKANGFGIEVKTVQSDTWVSTGNSVLETMRDPSTKEIYILFGNMGAEEVRWAKYDNCVVHVRVSHAPRFMVDLSGSVRRSLFEVMNVTYGDFAALSPHEKMKHIRKYAQSKLQPGERLWWLDEETGPGLPIAVKLYMHLSQLEKRKLRAEAAILCPQIVGGSREKDKYNDVGFFCLNHRSVFCPQTRDLFSAGSVAGKERGGSYVLRALKGIERELLEAAESLEMDLIEEYWGEKVKPENRIKEWLHRADSKYRGTPKPSDVLFNS